MSTDKFKIIKSIRQDFPFPDECPKVKENLHGWFGEGNKRLLLRYIRGTTKIVFEFGAWLGLSTKFILDATPSDCLVISIDHWEGGATIKNSEKYDELIESSYDTFIKNMWDYRDRLIPLRMDGNEAMHYLHKKGLVPDLIYLDMDHEYIPVKKDLDILTNYFPKSVIVGDDIKYHVGVDEAVNETGKRLKNYILEVDVNSYALIPPNSVKQEYQLRYKYKEPENPDPNLKLLIVVPLTKYKQSDIDSFRTIMSSLLEDVDHKIYFVEGNDNISGKSNIGMLCNAAVKYAQRKGYNNVIFNNLECIPNKDLVKYYKYKPKRPIILGAASTNFKSYSYNFGIISFPIGDIIRINGYPNYFWNISPDRDVINRLVLSDIKVWLPSIGVLQSHTRKKYDRKQENEIKQMIRQTWKKWRLDGLNNLDIVKLKRKKDIYTFDIGGYKVLLFPTKEIHITLPRLQKDRIFRKQIITNVEPTPDVTGFRKRLTRLKQISDGFKTKHLIDLSFPYSKIYDQVNDMNHDYYFLSILKQIPIYNIKKIALLSKVLSCNLSMTNTNHSYDFLNNLYSVTYLDYPLPKQNTKYDFICSNHRFINRNLLDKSASGIHIWEERSLQTRFEFLIYALENLNRGGSYHNLHFLPTSLISYQILELINNHFDEVKILKTPYGKYYGTVFHVIGIGFRGISNVQLNTYRDIQQEWYKIDQSKGMQLRYLKEGYDDDTISVSNILFVYKIINSESLECIQNMRIFIKKYLSNLERKVDNMQRLDYISNENMDMVYQIIPKILSSRDQLFKALKSDYDQFISDISSS